MRLSKDIAGLRVGFLTLMFVAFTRPIISALEGFAGLPIHKVVPAGLSYLLIVTLVWVFSSVELDTVGCLIIAFCCYAIFSIAWGSEVGELPAMVLPFICFFSARTFANNPRKSNLVLIALIIGYIVPVLGSAILMLTDASLVYVVYGSGAERQRGIYIGSHSAGHAMVFFSFCYALFLTYKKSIGKLFQYVVHFIFALSVYCLWNTYVRSAYLGFLTFWMFYLFRWRKRYFFVCFLALLALGFWKSTTLESVFWKSDVYDREHNLDTASSGRFMLWSHNLRLFDDLPFYTQMLGSGLGSESKTVLGGENQIWSSHNDYISLLMTQGVIGLLLYGAIFCALLRDIIRFRLHKQTQAVFLSAVLSLMATSMATNGYIFRFELSQLFWLFMGCSYSFYKGGSIQGHKTTVSEYGGAD